MTKEQSARRVCSREVSRLVASLFLVSCAASAEAPPPPPPRAIPIAPAPTPAPATPSAQVVEPSAEPASTASEPAPSAELPPLPADPGCKRDAIVLVVDRSGSMTGAPMEMAKLAAKRAVGKIGKDDCFGLVIFDSQPTRVIKMIPALDHAAAQKAIDGVAAGGGTEIFSALTFAYDDLRAAKAAKRRIAILLTDGQAPHNGVRDLVDAMATENIRVSTVGLGSGIDEAMLRMIADRGKGHLRKVMNPADLPKNIEEELASLRQ
jgi:hypothetical protein